MTYSEVEGPFHVHTSTIMDIINVIKQVQANKILEPTLPKRLFMEEEDLYVA